MSTTYGGQNGHMAVQTNNSTRDSRDAMNRRVLRRAVHREYTQPSKTGNGGTVYRRNMTPFRAWTGNGDYLGRVGYKCGGPATSTTNMPLNTMLRAATQNCDGTGIEGSSGNPKYVADAAEYATFRGLSAQLCSYNNW